MKTPNCILPHGKGEWKPTKYKVACCGDIIWSRRPGECRDCSCGKSFVDETREYCRLGGPFRPEKVEDTDAPTIS